MGLVLLPVLQLTFCEAGAPLAKMFKPKLPPKLNFDWDGRSSFGDVQHRRVVHGLEEARPRIAAWGGCWSGGDWHLCWCGRVRRSRRLGCGGQWGGRGGRIHRVVDDNRRGTVIGQIDGAAAGGGEAAAAIAVAAGGVERRLRRHAREGIRRATRGGWHAAKRIGRAVGHAGEQHAGRGLVDFDRDNIADVAGIQRTIRYGLGAGTQSRAFAAQRLVGGASKGAREVVGASEANGHIAVVPTIGVRWDRGGSANRRLCQVNLDWADRDRGGDIVGKVGARASIGGSKVCPSVLKVWLPPTVLVANPERVPCSWQTKLTLTALLFQPNPLAMGLTVARIAGAARSTFTV